jgi:hypothetical protein
MRCTAGAAGSNTSQRVSAGRFLRRELRGWPLENTPPSLSGVPLGACVLRGERGARARSRGGKAQPAGNRASSLPNSSLITAVPGRIITSSRSAIATVAGARCRLQAARPPATAGGGSLSGYRCRAHASVARSERRCVTCTCAATAPHPALRCCLRLVQHGVTDHSTETTAQQPMQLMFMGRREPCCAHTNRIAFVERRPVVSPPPSQARKKIREYSPVHAEKRDVDSMSKALCSVAAVTARGALGWYPLAGRIAARASIVQSFIYVWQNIHLRPLLPAARCLSRCRC